MWLSNIDERKKIKKITQSGLLLTRTINENYIYLHIFVQAGFFVDLIYWIELLSRFLHLAVFWFPSHRPFPPSPPPIVLVVPYSSHSAFFTFSIRWKLRTDSSLTKGGRNWVHSNKQEIHKLRLRNQKDKSILTCPSLFEISFFIFISEISYFFC